MPSLLFSTLLVVLAAYPVQATLTTRASTTHRPSTTTVTASTTRSSAPVNVDIDDLVRSDRYEPMCQASHTSAFLQNNKDRGFKLVANSSGYRLVAGYSEGVKLIDAVRGTQSHLISHAISNTN